MDSTVSSANHGTEGGETSPHKRSQETESLVKRLAGPSSGKAGLAKDQTEINRIIAEVSKGSKFYENEKKKDKELTARIEKILKQRDEAIKGVNIHKIEDSVDNLLAQLEAQRDLTKIVVHVDMDAFYANVELLDNPKLEGKPFAVGRGVLTTASYEARRYGVRSGMAGFVAKKLCPDLIVVSNRFSRYSEMSKKVMDVFRRYDPNMCPAGCDEGYLNITPYCEEHSLTAEECVQQMRETVYLETKLTVSAGIAPNKMLAKICSDKNKPNGQFQLEFNPKAIINFMRDLSIRKVPGVGRVNERLLEAIGIKTCGDIFRERAVVSLMDKQFGLMFLLRTHLGIASNVVQAHAREERKSIGAERTFSPLSRKEKILDKLTEISVELEKDMEKTGWTGRTITLKYKLDTYQVFTRAKSCNRRVSTKEELFAIGKELLLPEFPLTIRLIGLRVTKLKDLRIPDKTTNGIKRFFEPSKESSPRKKLKLEIDHPEEFEHELDTVDAQVLMEESMPGFHEHDETDYKIEDGDHDDIVEILDSEERATVSLQPSKPHRPTHSTAKGEASSSNTSEPQQRTRSHSDVVRRNIKPISNSKPLSMHQNPETHDCPICGRTLETDNQGLNAHIDFCLSRGAIMEAQVESNKSEKTETTKFTGWKKPDSIKSEHKAPVRSKSKPLSKRAR